MVADRPICILLGALGGQGGGVLADWLVEAAHHSGYPAQATSTPVLPNEQVQRPTICLLYTSPSPRD